MRFLAINYDVQDWSCFGGLGVGGTVAVEEDSVVVGIDEVGADGDEAEVVGAGRGELGHAVFGLEAGGEGGPAVGVGCRFAEVFAAGLPEVLAGDVVFDDDFGADDPFEVSEGFFGGIGGEAEADGGGASGAAAVVVGGVDQGLPSLDGFEFFE